jgi:hypothetical protein
LRNSNKVHGCGLADRGSCNDFLQEEKPMKRSILGVLLVLTFVAVGIAAAPPLTFTYSDVQSKNTALETDSYAVNNFGTIAGDYVDSNSVQHGMLLGKNGGTGPVNYNKCQAIAGTGGIAFFGLNSTSCTAVGWCTNSNGVDIGFSWTKGKFTDINFPKATGTQVTGINDQGDVVGLYFDATGASHGFSKIGNKYKTIDVKGETNTVAWGITNKGQITVYATNSAGEFDSFLVTGKTFKKINNPKAKGGLGTIVHTPSNMGDIDGTYFDSAGNEAGWLLHSGKYYDVVDPGGVTRADGLNDKGVIVGRYGTGSFGGIGFKATYK